MRLKWEALATAALVICAVVTTGLVVYRQFFAPATGPASAAATAPVFVKEWKSYLETGVRLGPSTASVQLIEFADFECPFCATFHKTLKALRERYPTQVALSYVHFPLSMHRFAEPAARAAECAADQGRFEPMQDRLFERQNAFGLAPWKEFASEAGVPDLAAFESCAESSQPRPRIVEGGKLAQELNVRGTPTLIINGWKVGTPPTLEQLDEMVEKILNGKSPVPKEGSS